ncbi:MAG: non-ribosomal peptide synthetase, partial [Bacteroidota bacterium]
MTQILLPTQLFVRRPGIWLDKVSEHKATITSSPNFGYNYLLKYNKSVLYDWDLSSLRIIYNGAEPISDVLAREFIEEMKKYGLKKHAMCPVYGLAEATLAVTISGLENEIQSIRLKRQNLKVSDRILESRDQKGSISFTNVGTPIHKCFVKILDDDNEDLEEEVIGHIHIKGENVTSGYYNNASATEKAISGNGWIHTGDLGFFKNGSLFVTGRSKDVFFINGTNYYAHDLEIVAQEVEGVELNKIAFAGLFNEQSKQSEVVAFIAFRGKLEKFVSQASSVSSHINANMGIEVHSILPVPSIPKTTSGKIQRYKLLQQYTNGEFRETEEQLKHLRFSYDQSDLSVIPSRNKTETKIAEIWKSLLKRTNVGINQSFFAIGGNSLKAAQMSMRFQEVFQVELPVSLIYQLKT